MLANLVAGVSSYIFPDWQTRVHVLVAYYCARLKVAISGKSCERDMNEETEPCNQIQIHWLKG